MSRAAPDRWWEGLMDSARLKEIGRSYAAAWSSQDASRVAACYAENGALRVNRQAPAVGRAAITAKAREFMTAFPDTKVAMDQISAEGENRAVFGWTNTGPGGTGRAVHLRGYEEWRLDPDGLIVESLGHFDEGEYQGQVGEHDAG